jgi:hypothetical protein
VISRVTIHHRVSDIRNNEISHRDLRRRASCVNATGRCEPAATSAAAKKYSASQAARRVQDRPEAIVARDHRHARQRLVCKRRPMRQTARQGPPRPRQINRKVAKSLTYPYWWGDQWWHDVDNRRSHCLRIEMYPRASSPSAQKHIIRVRLAAQLNQTHMTQCDRTWRATRPDIHSPGQGLRP